MNILVFGGAGYIGSVVVKQLVSFGHNVVVFDNLSKGRRDLVDLKAKFILGDILNSENLEEAFSANDFDAVMHFAAFKDAGESMRDPSKYVDNVKGTINILSVMDTFDVKKIVFSSSAAVYGNPQEDIITEEHPTIPLNFYGFTKLEGERLLEWYRNLRGIEYVSLRYFNVAGDGGLGYVDPDAKNIFPIIGEVINGKRDKLSIFGGDYDTQDGTCIRDYIHVSDLAAAHIKALELGGSDIINLGSGTGQSVLELVTAFKEISGVDIAYQIVGRREGDPAMLVASYQKAQEVLDWKPKHSLNDMVKSTLDVYNK